MTDETNGADMAAAEAAAVALNQPSSDKTYLGETAPEPEPKAEETPGEDAAAAKPDEGEAKPPKPKKTAQERIDELTWRVREAERREQALLDRIGGKQAPAQEAHPAAPESDEPHPDNYTHGENDLAYIRDLARYEARQEFRREAAQAEASKTVRTKLDTFQSKATEIFPDGEPEGLQAFRQFAEMPQAIADVILASDIGPKLAEHLGDNPREFQRLSGLSPALQARELTLLETRLSAPKEEPKPVPKTATDAPEPPPQARGSGGRFNVAADTSDFAAFEKQYVGR